MRICTRPWFPVAVILVGCAGCSLDEKARDEKACPGERTKGSPTVNGVDNPQLKTQQALRDAWRVERGKLETDPRSRVRLEILQLVELLRDRTSDELRDVEYRRLIVGPIDYNDPEDYDYYVLQAYVIMLCESGDRNRLVKLIADQLPPYVSSAPIEYYLASCETLGPDPILLLRDAYYAAANREKRENVAEAFLRGFPGASGITGSDDMFRQDDPVLIENCTKWYLTNRDKLALNTDYYGPVRFGNRRPELFISSPAAKPG